MAIFPLVEDITLPTQIITDRGANFLYSFQRNDFIMQDGKFIEVVGDAAVAFWIEKTLKTEFERAQVYKKTGYGSRLHSLVGSTLSNDILSSILEDDIKTALLTHERIKSLDDFSFEKVEDKVTVGFRVTLNPVTQIDGSDGSDLGFTRLSTLEDIKKFIGIRLVTSAGFYFKTSIGTQVYVGL